MKDPGQPLSPRQFRQRVLPDEMAVAERNRRREPMPRHHEGDSSDPIQVHSQLTLWTCRSSSGMREVDSDMYVVALHVYLCRLPAHIGQVQPDQRHHDVHGLPDTNRSDYPISQ